VGLIRLLLALSVVIVHSSQQRLFGSELVGGQAAVQAFYVISGFYMALVLNKKYPPGIDGYRTFILARLYRLFPAYGFILLLTIALAATNVVHHPALGRWKSEIGQMTWPTIALYGGSQLTLIGQDAVWFTEYDPVTHSADFAPYAKHAESPAATPAGDTTTRPADAMNVTRPGMDFLFVAQAWTLGVELLFYCVAPFIVRRIGLIGLFFILSWAVRLTLAKYGLRENPWSYRFFPSELAMFLMGSAGYHVYARLQSREEMLRKLGVGALVALLVVVFFLFKFDVPLRSLIVACATAACVPFIFALTKSNRFDRWVGELSYPVYISHELVRLGLIHHRGQADVLSMVLLTLVVSIALMLLVEQPIERMRARFIARRAEAMKPDATHQ
jgi:peptidoglycan/LPS O-acetylase OafA/YrhL